MNKNFSIKGLANKDSLEDKSLQSMYVDTLTGTIYSNCNLDDLFEINIETSILDKSSIEFYDMNLNTFNCEFVFKVIGIDNCNKGVFFKYNHDFIMTYKSFNAINSYKLIVLDGFFNKKSNSNIDFSLVVALDFSVEKSFINPHPNPISNADNNSISNDIDLFFNKEFI